MHWIRNTTLRSLLTRWCLAAWVVTQIAVGLGVFVLVDQFLWRSTEQQQLRAVVSLWQRRPLFMETDYAFCPPPAKIDLPPPRHLSRPLEFSEWGPLFAQAVAVTSDSCVRLYGPEGALLFSSAPVPDVPNLGGAEIAHLMAPGAPNQTSIVTGSQERFHVLLFPLVSESQHFTRGVLQVIRSSRADDDKLRTLAGYIVLSCSLALVVGYLLLLAIADALSSPLERLMATSRRVGDGDFDARTGLTSGRNEVFAVGAVFDRMAAKLKTSFVAQSRFVADASHELKTPLTTISGMAEVLEMGESGPDPQRRKALKTICSEVDHMSLLISDLLMLSQAEESPEVATGRVVVADVLEELVDSASMQGRNIVCDCPPLLAVAGPEGRLHRILGNLIDNALKYTPAEGSVSVAARTSGGRVLVEVSDTGPGIAPEALPHIFERFFREDRSRCRKTGGTGLGLAIVRALVRAMDGEVRVESAVGRGTRVLLSLPTV